MSSLRVFALTAILAGGVAGFSANPAKADVATRCDWNGCSHIVCNWTGDRCHRFYGDNYYRESYYQYGGGDRDYYHDLYRRYDGAYYGRGDWDRDRGWHYDCDNDADDCRVRRSWDGD